MRQSLRMVGFPLTILDRKGFRKAFLLFVYISIPPIRVGDFLTYCLEYSVFTLSIFGDEKEETDSPKGWMRGWKEFLDGRHRFLGQFSPRSKNFIRVVK
jgi:hypothetical protein